MIAGANGHVNLVISMPIVRNGEKKMGGNIQKLRIRKLWRTLIFLILKFSWIKYCVIAGANGHVNLVISMPIGTATKWENTKFSGKW